MHPSPTVKLASQLLAEDLGAWVARHRDDDRSWRWIAEKLGRVTDAKVEVTGEYLRQLYARRASDQVSA